MFLGAAILILFVTGLISHLHQHPLSWLPFYPEPAWAYRLNQGLHVAVGFATLPLVLAKLYTVYPQFFVRPPLTGLLHALERTSVGILVAATVFQIVTGILNVFKLYVFGFSFTTVHYATAWLAFGAALVHVGIKLPIVIRAFAAGARNLDSAEPTGTRRAEPRRPCPQPCPRPCPPMRRTRRTRRTSPRRAGTGRAETGRRGAGSSRRWPSPPSPSRR